jgi:hypothetical protein
MATSPQDRIAKGLAVLDEKLPEWAAKIKPKVFDIGSNLECVLAQLSNGRPYEMLKHLGLRQNQAKSHGFCINDDYSDRDALQEAWTAAIKERRKKK